jgi:hypothetical protein
MVDLRRERNRRVSDKTIALRIVDERVWNSIDIYFNTKIRFEQRITKSEFIEGILREFLRQKTSNSELEN